MKRRLIIDGNAVYEVDEKCMIKKRMDKTENIKSKTSKSSEYKK